MSAIIVTVDSQGRTTDLRKHFRVEPGDLFVGHREPDGTIVLVPARITREETE